MRRPSSPHSQCRQEAAETTEREKLLSSFLHHSFIIPSESAEDQRLNPFQISALRERSRNGVVRPLKKTGGDPEIHLRVLRGGCDDLSEKSLIHSAGTGKREEHSSWTEKLHGKEIDVLVTAGRLFPQGGGGGEFRGIEDNHVKRAPGIPAAPQELENIGFDGTERIFRESVVPGDFLRQTQCRI